jgi:hypothetical protein
VYHFARWGIGAGVTDGEQPHRAGSERLERSTRLTLEAAGITLIGVILSISLTVAFGLELAVWLKVAAGIFTAVALTAAVKLSAAQGAALRRLANWITRAGDR